MRVTGTSALRTAVRAVAAVTALGAGLLVVPAHASPGRAPWHVSIKADATGSVGKKVHLTGKVAASAAGRLVTLQEKAGAGKPWRNQRNALVHADGTYRTYDVPTVNQARRYRVVMPATPRHARGVSASVRVVVYQWQDLGLMTYVNQDGIDPVGSLMMNGSPFPASLEAAMVDDADTSQSIEFNLDHRCLRFRGAFGISDDSESDGSASVTASADGAEFYGGVFDVGEYDVAPVTTWVTAPLKLRFDTESLNVAARGLGALGTPQVYCTR